MGRSADKRKEAGQMNIDDALNWYGFCERCSKPCEANSWPVNLCRLCELGMKHAEAEDMWKDQA